ncbi:MAG: TldD/PmbA family protein [Candidatus Aminicenantes bacterium]|nr:TldD/PmbA family protein [Candidatus Aminicenantes bacterium]
MIEENRRHCLSIDNRDRTEYFLKNRKGLLTRKYEDMWESRSVELSSLTEAGKYLSKDLKLKLNKQAKDDFQFSPGKILRDNEFVIDALRNLDLPAWQVVFRANHSRRILVKKENKKRESVFKYFSILIKLKLKEHRDFIEVGEGSVQAAKFNQDGLLTRVKEIIENHKKSKNITFTDKIPVILNAGDGAIIFHEILGHSLEADYLYQGVSPISPADLGKKIVSPNVTLVTGDKKDDFFKNISWDDEGEAAKPIVLIKNGVLKNVIADSFHKELLNLKNCGFSRVKDFTGLPMPRMYALYLKPGRYHPGELIESTKYGVYAKEFGAGKVYFNKNLFYFNIKDAYLIENGRLSFPLGSVVVRGNIIETLNSVDKIADDFRYDKGSSYCFKNGQTINVRVGQPTVKINNLMVTKEIND